MQTFPKSTKPNSYDFYVFDSNARGLRQLIHTGYCLPTNPLEMADVIWITHILLDKDVMVFVAAAQQLHASRDTVRFLPVSSPDGGSPAFIRLENVKSWGGANRAEWWGWQDDIADVLRQADIVCLPPQREGLPKSHMEAAASGMPTVISNTVGCRDVVIIGQDGYLVTIKDARLLATAPQKLMADPELRRATGGKGRLRADNECSSASVVSETLAVDRQLMNYSGVGV